MRCRASDCASHHAPGYTYQLYTSCQTTKGLPILRLLDLDGTEVAYNEYVTLSSTLTR